MDELIEQARLQVLTDAARAAQKRSFAYGTAHIENEDVTRTLVDEEAERFAH